MKDKHIRQTIDCSCEKIGDKQYRTVNNYGEKVVFTYGDTERLIKKIIDRTNNKQQEENYYYGTAASNSSEKRLIQEA